jgi:hypothetical protein
VETVASIEMSALPLADAIAEEPMMEPWVELPLPKNRAVVYPKPGKLPLPDPIEIPDDES